MTYQTKTIITLDPEKDADIIRHYEKDKGWKKIKDLPIEVSYESESPIWILEKAIYLPNNIPYKRYMNEKGECFDDLEKISD